MTTPPSLQSPAPYLINHDGDGDHDDGDYDGQVIKTTIMITITKRRKIMITTPCQPPGSRPLFDQRHGDDDDDGHDGKENSEENNG